MEIERPAPTLQQSALGLDPKMSSLLSGSLEAFIHHLLYVRRVYPRESFLATRFLGVPLKANRHPGVVDYISDTLRTAVPALLSGTVDELAVVILKDETVLLERFALRFTEILNAPMGSDEESSSLLSKMEQGMRDMILRVHGLEGRDIGSKLKQSDASLCFKITLRVSNTLTPESTNPDVTRALSEGEWFHPDPNSCRPSSGVKVRPIHTVYVPGSLECKFVMECPS